MELSRDYIISVNTIHKQNIKIASAKKGWTLKELSVKLGMKNNYISNMCNKETSILNNNLLHKIAIILECTIADLNENITTNS